ncbi:hypothetical protein CYLTODRAFT_488371 [Cylindrobasidium torrendii FP15055 ss-10]|uniref:Uncharacterized protein n=1 Tax=Cylindrobasidium torrendii FP15055 ss-10 TaxID=1314674 RepID=A0A0D7BHY6_9AGAR|nr:hypothetical protein CYLTODRAFT_488371 [Cylindrobasidium torrendii FP15055 ss-10]
MTEAQDDFLNSWDVSFSSDFSNTASFDFVPAFDVLLPAIEWLSGLPPHAFSLDVDCAENTVTIQSNMRKELITRGLIFVPDNATLSKLLEILQRNQQCQLDERTQFDDPNIPELDPAVCTYTLMPTRQLDESLFTRDTSDGTVTEHKYPYPNLPMFKLTAHPLMVSARSYKAVIVKEPLLQGIGQSLEDASCIDALAFRRVKCATDSGSSGCSSYETASESFLETPDQTIFKWLALVPPGADPNSDLDMDRDGNDDETGNYKPLCPVELMVLRSVSV